MKSNKSLAEINNILVKNFLEKVFRKNCFTHPNTE